MTVVHVIIFWTLTILFFLLAMHSFDVLPAIVPGIEGIICGAAAVYASAAVIVNTKFGREVLPLGTIKK
jgi:succinate-acetate transporter protein